jgi:hypothetical protein
MSSSAKFGSSGIVEKLKTVKGQRMNDPPSDPPVTLLIRLMSTWSVNRSEYPTTPSELGQSDGPMSCDTPLDKAISMAAKYHWTGLIANCGLRLLLAFIRDCCAIVDCF